MAIYGVSTFIVELAVRRYRAVVLELEDGVSGTGSAFAVDRIIDQIIGSDFSHAVRDGTRMVAGVKSEN